MIKNHFTHYFICCVLLTMFGHSAVMAQIHDFSIGAHAGMAMYNTKDDIKNLPGAAVGIDVAYTARGVIANQTALGIKFGAGLSYAGATQSLPDYLEQYTNIDYYPEMMDYTITADKYKESQHQIQLEAPIYLSFITYGVTVNIGAKFLMPFFQKRHIDVTDAHITAYYPDFWVPTTDYLATGRLENNEYHAKESSNMPNLNALLSVEIGYEWNVGYKNKLGVQAYLDYGIWNNYSNDPPKERLIDVDPILNTEYPVPNIKVNALTDTYSDHVKYISAGIKVYFAFHTEIPRVAPCRCAYD